MPLDPVTAFALAGNVIQFIDFGCNLVSESLDLYKSAAGNTAENVELETVAKDIQDYIAPLRVSARSSTMTPNYLKLLNSCDNVAKELLSAVEQLKVKDGPHRKWRSFGKALRSIWKKEDISKLQSRLRGLREQIVLHVIDDSKNVLGNELQQLRIDFHNFNIDRSAQLKSIELAIESILLYSPKNITKSDLDGLGCYIRNSLSAVEQLSQEIKILESLYFESMEERHSRIVEAHCRTFEWIFNRQRLPSNDVRSNIALKSWLRSENELFWVSGKPGSGKSTFMKWLAQEPRTLKALQQWAEGTDLITASFYFWISGTSLQKSQQGLLRSLLFEILSKCPELIPTICPERWNATALARFQRLAPWGVPELAAALARLQTSSLGKKICFFVDGLDEYDGDHFDIIDVMANLAKSPHIKICLSSRPWNCFEDAFGRSPKRKLYLHDLTRGDIESFTRAKLPKAKQLVVLTRDAIAHDSLVLEIVDRSQGVFLWVYLVVRSLRHGMVNGDSISILQQRLRTLPADLELYFKHILTSVDPIYTKKVGSMFLAAVEADEPIFLVTHSFMDEDDPDFAVKLSHHPIMAADITTRQDVMRRRINGRSKGLLEVIMQPEEKTPALQKVSFLHRTVRDFLQLREINTMLKEMAPPLFDACHVLARAFGAEVKSELLHYGDAKNALWQCLVRIAHLAWRAEKESGIADVVLLDDLENLYKTRCQMFFSHETSFLEFAIEHDLSWYVKIKLNRQPELGTSRLLITALAMFSKDWERTDSSMVKMLLDQGLSPNGNRANMIISPWHTWASDFDQFSTRQKTWTGIARLLLVYGAEAQGVFFLLTEAMYENLKDSTMTLQMAKHLMNGVSLLLSHGLNPNNETEGECSIWLSFLSRITTENTLAFPSASKFILDIFLLFISYGADASVFEITESHAGPQISISSRKGKQVCFDLIGLEMKDVVSAARLIEVEKQYQESRHLYRQTRKRKSNEDAEQASKRLKEGMSDLLY